MNELENYLELQNELNVWEMELAFAEVNSQYLDECNNIINTTFGGLNENG